jgi:ketosteroid isomerase-like protein
MTKCPNCGLDIEEADPFCKHCGTKLTATAQGEADAEPSDDDDVKNVVVKRLDAIKNKDEGAVRALMDEGYTKFDDWPPFERQEAAKALENEFAAFKVLSSYSYELVGFEANRFGDAAVATFILRYKAVMRNRTFDVTSRVTSVLRKQDSGWKIVHEHYSRFPEQIQRQFGPRRTMQP